MARRYPGRGKVGCAMLSVGDAAVHTVDHGMTRTKGLMLVITAGVAAVGALSVGVRGSNGVPSLPVDFLSWRQAPFGGQTEAIDAGDFNEDGHVDLVVMNGAILELLLGDGTGNFGAPLVRRRGGSGRTRVVARDLNGDGHLDVAVAYRSGAVWLFEGDGAGELSDGVPVDTGGTPGDLVATDVDGDGDLDLVVALLGGSVTGHVQLLRNDGRGGFSLDGPAVEAGILPRRITAGDFDGDGFPDVAVTNEFGKTATVLFNDGSGRFGDRLTLTTTPNLDFPSPFPITAGDVNGDGRDDLLVGNGLFDVAFSGSGGLVKDSVDIRFGNGALFLAEEGRGFGEPIFLPLDNAPRELRLVDIDGDGQLDIASGGVWGILTLLNRDGTFSKVASAPAHIGEATMAVADFNNDGRVDFILGRLSPRVDVYLQQPDGQFPVPFRLRTEQNPDLPEQFFQPTHAVAADVNNDGIIDLVTTTGQGETIVTFLGRGGGDFGPPLSTIVGRQTSWFVVADFTGDALLDVALTSIQSGEVFLELFARDATGLFSFRENIGPPIGPPGGYGRVACADFNADGQPDVAAFIRRFDSVGTDVFINEGGGSFGRSASLVATNFPFSIEATDLDGDSHADLVLQGSRAVSTFLGRGDGTFGEEVRTATPTGGGVTGVALADFDEDGWIDLALSQSAGREDPFGNFWLRGDGRGGFHDPIFLTPEHAGLTTQGSFVGAMTAADFNDDGHQDIAVASFEGVTIFQGYGNGNFVRSPYFAMVTGCGGSCPLTAADLNGNGLIDLTTPSSSYTEEGKSAVGLTLLFNTTRPAASLCTGDCDGGGVVTIGELLRAVNIALGAASLDTCSPADANADEQVTVSELVGAISSALRGCQPTLGAR